jgi:hypothetical protein
MRVLLVRVWVVLLLASSPLTVEAAQAPPALFTTEAEAQQQCPRDVVVWLNLSTGIYHFKGQRWYGRTKHGAFV